MTAIGKTTEELIVTEGTSARLSSDTEKKAKKDSKKRKELENQTNEIDYNLKQIEEKLLFMKKTINQEQKIQQILLNLTKIQKDSSDKQVNSILEGIKKELNCLV